LDEIILGKYLQTLPIPGWRTCYNVATAQQEERARFVDDAVIKLLRRVWIALSALDFMSMILPCTYSTRSSVYTLQYDDMKVWMVYSVACHWTGYMYSYVHVVGQHQYRYSYIIRPVLCFCCPNRFISYL